MKSLVSRSLRFVLVLSWSGYLASPLVTCAAPPDASPDTVPSSPVVRAEDAKAAVLTALRAMVTKAFRMAMYLDTTPPQSPQSVSRMDIAEFVPPDRLHTRTTSASGVVSETIRIGEQAYSKHGDGPWEVSRPLLRQRTITQMMESILADIEKGVSTVTFVGTEEVNGELTNVYQVFSTAKVAEVETQGANTLWIRKADGLVVKQASEMTPRAEAENPQVKVRSVQTYEYDPTITVEAPALPAPE
jgi:hypothetical protein